MSEKEGSGQSQYPSFSIVINTLNRGTELHNTLTSLRWLKYSGDFEVIVVNGPSTDNSDEIIASWLPSIRAGRCDVANLSVSRNIGICMAQGDIVAFIDDDAIPEPEWLTQLTEVYRDPMVGAAGGLVYNHTGYDFQYEFCLVDRFANADLTLPGPTPQFSFPQSIRFPHLLGCNSSFRRTALLEIGGFDEEFEYFLDETDVCLRIVDAGYVIAQLPCAYVHHKFAASNMRGENKIARERYAIIKNKIYFMLKHAREHYSLDRIFTEQQKFIESQRNEIQWAVTEQLLAKEDEKKFEDDLERAIETGVQRGLASVVAGHLINDEKIRKYTGSFFPFSNLREDDYRTVVFVSQDFPPDHGGGIATFTKDLAEALAEEGHIIHVITKSPDINRVDFENGVWVHRVVVKEIERSEKALAQDVPQHIWNWSATAFEEAERIATHRKIDFVEAPIWDCEGVAFLYYAKWPLITSLHTTLLFWLESNQEYINDPDWMSSFGRPIPIIEKELIVKSNGIRANSRAIIKEIETRYDLIFDSKLIKVIPHGLASSNIIKINTDETVVDILFVGRLEHRKGIDILLKAIPKLMVFESRIQVKIIGDDTLPDAGGRTYKEKFFAENSGATWISRVSFEGRVDADTLLGAYANCDIFVAPSRFESFGLIFLEAMREGKPVIGCQAGGMPEVVTHNVNGLLVEPANVEALVEALQCLVQDEELRNRMGKAGRRIFEEKFTAARMAAESAELYNIAEKNYFAGMQT